LYVGAESGFGREPANARDEAIGAMGYGRPNEESERRSFAFAGIVALWRKAWSQDLWPAALNGRLPAAPDTKLMEQALSAARTLAGQVITRDSALRMIWEGGSDRGAVLHAAVVNGGNHGEQRGFRPIEHRAVRVGREASDPELGAGLRRAFELCTYG
jgi:hypothetical protein